jgi:hypothetical protein
MSSRSLFLSRSRYPGLLAAGAVIALGTSPAAAQLTFFTTRPTFNVANPGLPVETFEEARVAAGDFAFFTGPLNAASNNAVFVPGEILPGLSLVDNPGANFEDLVAIGTGTVTGATKAVGQTFSDDTLDLTFSNAFSAGFDLFSAAGPGAPAADTITVSVFSSSGLLGSTNVDTLGGISFFGVRSSVPITRINVNSLAGNTSFVDNVAFGVAAPEPATGALLLLGVMGGLAGVRRRR